MPIVYLFEHDSKFYGAKFEKTELVEVQKFEKIYDDENNILCVKHLKKFLGKCDVTKMLMKLGNLDKSVFS